MPVRLGVNSATKRAFQVASVRRRYRTVVYQKPLVGPKLVLALQNRLSECLTQVCFAFRKLSQSVDDFHHTR